MPFYRLRQSLQCDFLQVLHKLENRRFWPCAKNTKELYNWSNVHCLGYVVPQVVLVTAGVRRVSVLGPSFYYTLISTLKTVLPAMSWMRITWPIRALVPRFYRQLSTTSSEDLKVRAFPLTKINESAWPSAEQVNADWPLTEPPHWPGLIVAKH